MKSIHAIIVMLAAAATLASCAGMQERCDPERPARVIVPSRVPEGLRDLVPLARRWGTATPGERRIQEAAITAREMEELRDSLHGRTAAMEQWLDAAGRTGSWSAETCAFRSLLDFYNSMNDVRLMRALHQ